MQFALCIFAAPAHDVVEQSRGVYSGFPQHGRFTKQPDIGSKLISKLLPIPLPLQPKLQK
ncbi:MAG: hypothetical protein CVU43_05900 [Chloroflexi bacterium HGW-Chloroflexi-5]|nr:MAG: hypothetical protein CVU43_05900 [Chloroflexi bacterium HGW-Chloroflexi-5]